MKPYYDDGQCVIYHGDCREVVPTLGLTRFLPPLILTDPPYGVSLNTAYHKAQRERLAASHDYPPVHGDDQPFDPTWLVEFPFACLWGANYYANDLPRSGQWLVWDKRDGMALNDQADCELAWTKGAPGTVPRVFRHMWNGMLKDSERSERRVHPTQKPVALMQWCLTFFPDAKTVLDPYMGSGSTLRAAKDAGRQAIGIEFEERYCEIAASRLAQEVLPLVELEHGVTERTFSMDNEV